MELKTRQESEELLILRSLNNRMELLEKKKQHYTNLEKGFEGELKFDYLLKELREERFIINDLLLKINNSYFQIDSLIISQGLIHLLDIKNFEGDYYLESDKLFSVSTGREYKNPVIQLHRTATLFRQLLQSLKQNFLIESSVIFINPEFMLYQAPMDQPIIFPTQVNRFLRKLNKTPSKLNEGHEKLAQLLISLHQPKNPFTPLHEYTYDQLEKGTYCKRCKSFQVKIQGSILICKACGENEPIKETIVRNAYEFHLLFPDRRITTNEIFEWCQLDLTMKTIRRSLIKNFTSIGTTSDTFYEMK